MRCARLAAPFVTALCIFDTLRGASAARRSCRMVSCRAYSSPVPQPASRHSIKPFSIKPIIANIRHSAGFRSQYRFAIWGRRCGEWPFEYTPQKISRSESGFMANVCYDGVALFTTTSVQQQESDGRVSIWKTAGSHVQAYPARHVRCPHPPRAGRLFAACRATGKGGESKRKWSE